MTTKTLKDIGKLGVLLLALGGILYYNRSAAPTAAPTASAPPPSKPAVRDKSGAPLAPADGSLMDVKLDLLAAQTDSYGPPQRDPFRFKPKPTPVVKAAAPPPVVVVTQPPVRPTPAPQPPQGDSPERLIRYSGYIVNASGKAVAVMSFGLPSSPTVQIYGTEGDIIEGRFRLQRIEPNAIEVSGLSGEGRPVRISRQ